MNAITSINGVIYTKEQIDDLLNSHTSNKDNPHNTNKSQVGLGDVENIALSTWNGSTNISTLGNIQSGIWNANPISWNKINKTGSSIADIILRSHTLLTDIGNNTHSDIDNFINSKAQANGLASLDSNSLVIQNPANAVLTPAPSKIPISNTTGSIKDWTNDYTQVVLEDEFIAGLTTTGNVGALGWSLGAGSLATKNGETAHPGIKTLSSGTTSGTIGRITLGGSATELTIVPGDISYIAFVVRPVSGTTTMSVRIGLLLSPSTSGEGSQGIYFAFTPATSGNWRTITRDGAGITANTTNISYSTGTWYFLEIRRSGSSYEFYINNVLRFTHTTNIPTSVGVISLCIETNEAVAKTIDIDYFCLKSITLGQRWS